MDKWIKKYTQGLITLAELADQLCNECIKLGEMEGAAGLMYVSLCLDKDMENKYKKELLEIASYMDENI